MEAALSLWQYCEDSARYIFGNNSGDKLADDILQSLRDTENGLSRTEIIKSTGKNYNAKRLNIALQLLVDNNLASCLIKNKLDSKKPIEFWSANEFNELNEVISEEEQNKESLNMGLSA